MFAGEREREREFGCITEGEESGARSERGEQGRRREEEMKKEERREKRRGGRGILSSLVRAISRVPLDSGNGRKRMEFGKLSSKRERAG
eukprot:scaffold133762_cov28-Tisochrysis_lutea.AAC.1